VLPEKRQKCLSEYVVDKYLFTDLMWFKHKDNNPVRVEMEARYWW